MGNEAKAVIQQEKIPKDLPQESYQTPRVFLSFDPQMDAEALKSALEGHQYLRIITELDNALRGVTKYGDKFPKKNFMSKKSADALRCWIRLEAADLGIVLPL
jgi:hypothetical protein